LEQIKMLLKKMRLGSVSVSEGPCPTPFTVSVDLTVSGQRQRWECVRDGRPSPSVRPRV
jgi:hypothetical protein